MALVVQVLLSGLAAGAGYGLLAVGTSLVYRLTGVVHFALGEIVGLAILVTLAVAGGAGQVSRATLTPERIALGMPVGILAATILGGGLYVLAVRPFLRRGSLIGWVGGLLAATFAARGILAATFVRETLVFPDPFGLDRLRPIALGGGATLQPRWIVVAVVGVALAAVAALLLDQTRIGRAMRAVASNTEGAHEVGLPVERLLVGAFAAAGGLAALAGIIAVAGSPVSADTGALLGLKGLAAALLAGFGSPWRSFLAGLVLGVVETSVASLSIGDSGLGPALRDVVPLALAILVMGIRARRQAAAEVE